VVSIERIGPLADQARAVLQELGVANVTIYTADGSEGWPDGAPWDAIIVTAGAPTAPQHLLDQLRESGGRLVMPVGPEGAQTLIVVERHEDGYDEQDIGPVAFVPLIGKGGWPEP
ncbi:MAG: protein-L-isoaspartate O-methyltransferase, partial [Thermomicrobiales bacterium]